MTTNGRSEIELKDLKQHMAPSLSSEGLSFLDSADEVIVQNPYPQ